MAGKTKRGKDLPASGPVWGTALRLEGSRRLETSGLAGMKCKTAPAAGMQQLTESADLTGAIELAVQYTKGVTNTKEPVWFPFKGYLVAVDAVSTTAWSGSAGRKLMI